MTRDRYDRFPVCGCGARTRRRTAVRCADCNRADLADRNRAVREANVEDYAWITQDGPVKDEHAAYRLGVSVRTIERWRKLELI